jgi:hypothetical protein
MLAFTKEAVHEVVAAKVSRMESCEHQGYLLQELQLDEEKLRVLNETQFLEPLKRLVVGTLLVVDRKTNAVLGSKKRYSISSSRIWEERLAFKPPT